jgi:hypothetical protein
MGFILVLAVLSLAIFVCISNTVFSLVAQLGSMGANQFSIFRASDKE